MGTSFDHVDALTFLKGDVVAGGVFTIAGGVPVSGLARWSPTTGWQGFPPGGGSWATALHAWQGALVVGNTPGVQRWNGAAWQYLVPGNPLDDVLALTTYRGDLIAGGTFDTQVTFHNHVARYDGITWHSLAQGINGTVWALTPWDPDGTGPSPELLIAGGGFTDAGGVPANSIAAWDGTQWSALGTGVSGTVRALAVWNNDLIVGGGFSTAGGIVSPNFARYGCPDPPCFPDCNGDGALTLSDFGCFQTRFAVGNMLADCNRDGLLQLSDFGCFITKYALGCP